MARETLDQRLARLNGRGAELAGVQSGEVVYYQPVHAAMMRVTEALLEFSSRALDSDAPTYLKVPVQMLRRAEPQMAALMANADPVFIQDFCREVIAILQTVVDAPVITEVPGGLDEVGTAQLEPAGAAGGHQLALDAGPGL